MVITRSQHTDPELSVLHYMETSTDISPIPASNTLESRFESLQQSLQVQINSQFTQILDMIQQKLSTSAHMPTSHTVLPSTSAFCHRQSSPSRESDTSEHPAVDLVTTDPFHDIRLDIRQMHKSHLDAEHTRQQANINQQQLMRKVQFNIRTDGAKFRSFIKKFVRLYNSARSDIADAPAIFLAALHDDTVTWLQRMRCDMNNLDAMVQILAKQCCPKLSDSLLTLQQLLVTKPTKDQQLDAYYYHLLDFHLDAPDEISQMLVLTVFIQNLPSTQAAIFRQLLLTCEQLPSPLTISNFIRLIQSDAMVQSFVSQQAPTPTSMPINTSGTTQRQSHQPQQQAGINTKNTPSKSWNKKDCYICHGKSHGALNCQRMCCNCKGTGHVGYDCPVPCRCGRKGGHMYYYCDSLASEQQQCMLADTQRNQPATVPRNQPLPQQQPSQKQQQQPQQQLSTMIVQAHTTTDAITHFEQANDSHGLICFRNMTIGGFPARVGIDTGCSHSTIAQTFLDKFDIPEDWTQSVNVEVDNGTPSKLVAQHKVFLPLQLKSGENLDTSWLVLPSLAQPLDALLSWSWAIKTKLLIDASANIISFKEPIPNKFLVPTSYHILQPRHPALTAPVTLEVAHEVLD